MKNIKLIVFAFLAMTMVTSCIVDDEPDMGYQDGSYFVGFEKKIEAVTYFVDEGVVLKQYPVKLLGGRDGSLLNQDLVITYTIDPSSTAVEGQEFDFVSNTGSLTLPAGAKYVNFPLNVNTGSLDPESPTRLILKLTGTSDDGTVVSAINSTLKVTFVGCLADLDEYAYDVTVLNDGSAAGTFENSPIYKDGVNEFRTRLTGNLTPEAYGIDESEAGISFSVLCGEISIPDQGLFQGMYGGNPVKDLGSGTVNADGSFTLKFSLKGFGNFEQTYTLR